MVKVTVRNDTDINIRIESGSNAVYSKITTLRPKGKYSLEVDPNATYKEFVLIKLPDNNNLDPVITSDDLLEMKEVVVKMRANMNPVEYYWQGISKNECGGEVVSKPNNRGGRVTWSQWFRSHFG